MSINDGQLVLGYDLFFQPGCKETKSISWVVVELFIESQIIEGHKQEFYFGFFLRSSIRFCSGGHLFKDNFQRRRTVCPNFATAVLNNCDEVLDDSRAKSRRKVEDELFNEVYAERIENEPMANH